MRRAASTLKTITPARSFAAFGPPPVFEEGVKKLEEKGIKYAQHVGMSNADSNPKAGKCPMLNHNKDLMYSVMNESNGRGYVRRYPLSIAKAQGVTLTDTEGREYLDCLGCAGTLALGHNHPVTVKAIRDFLDSGAPLQVLDMATPYKMEFMKELKSVMPEELSRLHFCSPAGTDCLDAAVKLCKTATGRSSVLSFHGGYHGMGQSTMAMMGNLGCKTPVSGLMPEVYFLPYPYEYRNPFGMNGEEGDRAVMKYIETVLNDDESGITKPACVVVEAIQGEGGVHAMSDWCLQELRRITKKFDVPLVIDEVQAGFCRSGNIFAYEKSGIVPDVVCMSKAVGGSMPMAVIGFTEELDKWAPASHTGTFRGNQLSFATGTASLKFMKENRLWEKVAKQGEHLHARVSKLQKEVNTIGNIRGRGLMWGVEMVNDKKGVDHSGTPLPDGDLAAEIQLQCYRRGMLMEKGGRAGAVMRFLCPLIISDEELDRALDIFEECVKVAEEKLYK